MDDQMLFVEKYRPKTIAECILPENLKKIFQEMVDKKEIPNMILSGGPGVGKTTVARALCEEVGCDYIIINGSDENGIDVLRTKIKSYASSISLSGGRKVIIIDEADYLNANSIQPALRGAIEEFAKNCSFIFTCNYKYRLIPALHSRCTPIEFKINGDKQRLAAEIFKRVWNILTEENITAEKKVIVEIVKKHFPDTRRILNELQTYSSSGSIDDGILYNSKEIEIGELIQFLKDRNFQDIRRWVAVNSNDHIELFRKVYDSASNFINPDGIPQLVVILAKYQYMAGFVADQEINMVACLTEIMIECEFK